MREMLEHPDITSTLRTGYPSWMQDDEPHEEPDEDALYEERREREMFGWE